LAAENMPVKKILARHRGSKKMNISVEELCRDLPLEFSTSFKYVRDLGFDDEPNYSYLRKLLRNLFLRKGFEYDNVFDWTIKKVFMIYESTDELAAPQTRDGTKATSVNGFLLAVRARRRIRSVVVEHTEFDYDSSAPIWTEFNRMRDDFEWDSNDYEMQQARRKFKSAMVQQFNDLYGTDEEDLNS